MRQLLPLQSQGTGWIDINGLNKSDQQRIRSVGLNKWLDEITGKTNGKLKVRVDPKMPKGLIKFEDSKGKTVGVITNVGTSKSKLKAGSIGDILAFAFLKLAQENKNIVTYEQTAILCPAYPGDPALWARAAGAEVITERKNKRYLVIKYV